MTRPLYEPGHESPSDGGAPTPAELAAMYAVGALTETERAEFEARLQAGEEAYVIAWNQALPAARALLEAPRPLDPPPDVRAALAARLGVRTAPGVEQAAAHEARHEHEHDHAHEQTPELPLVIMRAGEIKWKPTGLPGVRQHVLLADKRANRKTLLLKMEAGSRIPDHGHAGVEEVMVLEGDLSIGDVRLAARDYFCVRSGVRHGEPRTEKGCIALVFSSYSAITTRTKVGFALDVLRTLLGGGRRSA